MMMPPRAFDGRSVPSAADWPGLAIVFASG